MSYHGDNDSRSYASLGPIGYQEPFPGGKPLNPYRDIPIQPQGQEYVTFQLTREENELIAQINRKNNVTKFVPMAALSIFTLRHLINKGTIKVRSPPGLYFAAGFTSLMISKFLTIREVKREILQKFPEGNYAKTLNMTPAQRMEFIRQKYEEDKAKAALQGQAPEEAAHYGPDSRKTVTELDERFRPTVDSFDIVKRQEDPESKPAARKTYAELRQQAHQDVAQQRYGRPVYNTSQDQPAKQITPALEDPPSKLRTVKRNKYGDEIE